MYDNLYRVTRTIYDDSDPSSPTYASARTDDWLMDDIGNRTKIYAKSATPTEYEHNAVNEYTSVGGTGFEYDAAGNLTKDDTHYYFWDYMNRLTKVELVADSSDVAAYTYDANNRRVEKIDYTADPDETTQYFYAGLPSEASAKAGWSCIEEREDDGTLLATYINGPRIDEYILMNRDSTDYWYMQSPIVGNVAALVNSSGEIQEGYKYRAYGEAGVLTGDGDDDTWFTSDDDTATVSALGNPYTFTGRRLDGETMLLYFRNRMYQPLSGSFISRDPTGYVDGMSLYLGYFAPMRTDPLGLLEWPWTGCCDGKSYNKITKCCRNKTIYSRKERTPTGAYKCSHSAHGYTFVDHMWLESDAGNIDVVAGDNALGIMGSTGVISDAESYVNLPDKVCEEHWVNTCTVKPFKFKLKLWHEMQAYKFGDKTWTYIVGINDCTEFVDHLLVIAESLALYDDLG